MHEYLDENGDGQVDKKEFVSRLGGLIGKKSLTAADLGAVFITLDRNGDGSISLNEFKSFIKTAEKSREKRRDEIDPAMKK